MEETDTFNYQMKLALEQDPGTKRNCYTSGTKGK